MLTCREASRLLSDRMDADLPLRDRLGLGLHTMMCSGCRQFGRQLGMLRGFGQGFGAGADESDAPRTDASPGREP